MRCDWQNDPSAPTPCHVVNLDTGEVLSPCAMADEETGEYECYVYPFRVDPATKRVMTERGKARIEIRRGPPPKIDTDALIDAVDGFLHDVSDADFVDKKKWSWWTTMFHELIYVRGKQGPAEARRRMRERIREEQG